MYKRVLDCRRTDCFEKNEIMYDNQFDFRQNWGTENALARLTDLLYNGLDESEPSIFLSVFPDWAKGYNTVKHQLLLPKLESVVIKGTALELLQKWS